MPTYISVFLATLLITGADAFNVPTALPLKCNLQRHQQQPRRSWLSAMSSTRMAATPASQLRELLAKPGIITMPCCFDALSAKLVQRAGFDLTFMSGFSTSAAKLAMPDTGYMSYGEVCDLLLYSSVYSLFQTHLLFQQLSATTFCFLHLSLSLFSFLPLTLRLSLSLPPTLLSHSLLLSLFLPRFPCQTHAHAHKQTIKESNDQLNILSLSNHPPPRTHRTDDRCRQGHLRCGIHPCHRRRRHRLRERHECEAHRQRLCSG